MKTAIYIEDGVTQLVITPENDFEKNAISTLCDKTIEAKIFSGGFYDCRGGWVRQSAVYLNQPYSRTNEDRSLIIKVCEKEETPDEYPQNSN